MPSLAGHHPGIRRADRLVDVAWLDVRTRPFAPAEVAFLERAATETVDLLEQHADH